MRRLRVARACEPGARTRPMTSGDRPIPGWGPKRDCEIQGKKRQLLRCEARPASHPASAARAVAETSARTPGPDRVRIDRRGAVVVDDVYVKNTQGLAYLYTQQRHFGRVVKASAR